MLLGLLTNQPMACAMCTKAFTLSVFVTAKIVYSHEFHQNSVLRAEKKEPSRLLCALINQFQSINHLLLKMYSTENKC